MAIAIGVFAGVGSYTFHYGEGLSYFSADPASCANCHIMRPQYESWQKSSHHAVAACVDCHLPHGFWSKWLAKAENGWFHSKAFTTQDFHEPIMIKPKNAHILQESCLFCHEGLVHELLDGARAEWDSVQCVHCHLGVGHGPTAGLGGYDIPSASGENAR